MLTVFGELAVYSGDGLLKRWETPIQVEFKGNYTQEDINYITGQLDIINGLGLLPPITVVQSNGNYAMHYAPAAEMKNLLEFYEEGTYPAYTNFYWNDNHELTSAITVISTDTADLSLRNAYGLRNIMIGLGFTGDNLNAKNSVMEEGNPAMQLTENDYILLSMLYNAGVKCGMTADQAKSSLVS